MSNPLEDNVSGQPLSPNPERITGIDFTPLNTPVPSPDGPTNPPPADVNTIGASVTSIAVDQPQITIPPNYNLFMASTAPSNDFGADGDWYWMIVGTGHIRIYHKVDCIWALASQTPGGLGCPDGCPAGGDLRGAYLDPTVQMVHHVGDNYSITIASSVLTLTPVDASNNLIIVGEEGIVLSNSEGHNINITASSGPQIAITNGGDGSALFLSPGNDNIYLRNAASTTHCGINLDPSNLLDLTVVDEVQWRFQEGGCTWTRGALASPDQFFSVSEDGISYQDGATGASFEFYPTSDGLVYSDPFGKTLQIGPGDMTHNMGVREIDVCVAGVAKKMLVIASAPY